MDAQKRKRIVTRRLATLPPRAQQAFTLVYYYEYLPAEVDRDLGWQPGTCKLMFFRAQEALLAVINRAEALERDHPRYARFIDTVTFWRH